MSRVDRADGDNIVRQVYEAVDRCRQVTFCGSPIGMIAASNPCALQDYRPGGCERAACHTAQESCTVDRPRAPLFRVALVTRSAELAGHEGAIGSRDGAGVAHVAASHLLAGGNA